MMVVKGKQKFAALIVCVLVLSALFSACGTAPPTEEPVEQSSVPSSAPESSQNAQSSESPVGTGNTESSQSAPAPASAGSEAPASSSAPAEGEKSLPSKMRYLCDQGFDYAEEFQNGYAFALRGLDCGYVDQSGVFQVCYQISQEIWDNWFHEVVMDEVFFTVADPSTGDVGSYFPMSEEGLYPFYQEGSGWGYRNILTGETIVEPQFDFPAPFSEGRAVAAHTVTEVYEGGGSAHSEYKVLDTSGRELFRPREAFQGRYCNGLLQANMGEEETCHLVDRDGNIVMDLGFPGYFNVTQGEPYGYEYGFGGSCNNEGAWDPEHILTWLADENNNVTESFYINSSGQRTLTTPAGAVNVGDFRGGVCGYLSENGKWGLWNYKGELLTSALYEDFGYFGYNGDPAVLAEEDYSWATEDGVSYCILDNKGQKVGTEIYEGIGGYSDGLMAVCKAGKWGYLVPDEGMVIDFAFDASGRFSEGISWVEKDGEHYYINKKGEQLEGASTEVYYTCEEGAFLTFNDGKYNFAVIDTDNR